MENNREEKIKNLCIQLKKLSENTVRNSVIEEVVEMEKHLDTCEKNIIDKILETLGRMKDDYRYAYRINYFYDQDYAHMIEIETDLIGNKPLNIEIETRDGFVGLRSVYPFVALTNCLPLVSLKLLEINYESYLFKANVNPEDGEIEFRYLYEINKEEEFDVEKLFVYFDELLKISRKEYIGLQRICSGKVPKELSDYYRNLLKWTMYDAYGLQIDNEIDYENENYEEIAKTIKLMAPFCNKTSQNEFEFNIVRDIFCNFR